MSDDVLERADVMLEAWDGRPEKIHALIRDLAAALREARALLADPIAGSPLWRGVVCAFLAGKAPRSTCTCGEPDAVGQHRWDGKPCPAAERGEKK